MKKIVRTTLIVLLGLLILIQFIRPEKTTSNHMAGDISIKYSIPANVDSTLKIACYDCHSNNPVYPWYWNFQPVAWFMNSHIAEGRKHLNFSEFASYDIWRQYRKLEEIGDEVKSGDMPLNSYTLIHADARLSDQEKSALLNWIESTRKQIEGKYPPDSLIRKKR